MQIRHERPQDVLSIRALVNAAFDPSGGNTPEADIIDGLRAGGALALSLVAVQPEIIGHVAFSPVSLAAAADGWYGLAPLAVTPAYQGKGVGSGLVREGLAELARRRAKGCVVVGYPEFYGRFGFLASGLSFAQVPPQYVLALAFDGERPSGPVAYHPAFG